MERCRGSDVLSEQLSGLDRSLHAGFWLAQFLVHWIHRGWWQSRKCLLTSHCTFFRTEKTHYELKLDMPGKQGYSQILWILLSNVTMIFITCLFWTPRKMESNHTKHLLNPCWGSLFSKVFTSFYLGDSQVLLIISKSQRLFYFIPGSQTSPS